MTLINQPSKIPNRKIAAVIISGMIIGGLQSGLQLFWPDHPFAPLMDQFDVWIQAGVMIAAGYLARERK